MHATAAAEAAHAPGARPAWLKAAVVVGALGYFVDVYDLLLFSIVRVPSLRALGVEGPELLSAGIFLLNAQMAGLLVGGILWGVLGDKRGRVSVLLGSILLYSTANIANAFVTTIPAYAALRFVAGVGLAGELGAAITLVTEVLPPGTRGVGTTIVATVGVMGAVVAGLVGNFLPWNWAYIVGGSLGLLLLVGRWSLAESGMFHAARTSSARRGDLRLLFGSGRRARRFLWCVLLGLPTWYAIGVLVTFSPELSGALGVAGAVSAGTAVMFAYVGITGGDLASGLLSQRLRSRRLAMIAFLAFTALVMFAILFTRGLAPPAFYALCVALGFGAGYWAVFVTNAAEQFGTNLRATVTTTVPNLVRGATVPMTLAFHAMSAPFGLVRSALAVGTASILLALFAVRSLDEPYGKDLAFVEE